jgi:hypothetical protein
LGLGCGQLVEQRSRSRDRCVLGVCRNVAHTHFDARASGRRRPHSGWHSNRRWPSNSPPSRRGAQKLLSASPSASAGCPRGNNEWCSCHSVAAELRDRHTPGALA